MSLAHGLHNQMSSACCSGLCRMSGGNWEVWWELMVFRAEETSFYPLVNSHITMENIGKSPFSMGKLTISTGPFSIANC